MTRAGSIRVSVGAVIHAGIALLDHCGLARARDTLKRVPALS